MKKELMILTTILTVLTSCNQTVKENENKATDPINTEIKEISGPNFKTMCV
jgi:hypothetical protein